MNKRIVFISGHLDLTMVEFMEHYADRIIRAHDEGASFVVGDARGADEIAQKYLADIGADVTVFHMHVAPRKNPRGFPTAGGYSDDEERDAAMTTCSTEDIAWVRPGREKSGTARNLARRNKLCA